MLAIFDGSTPILHLSIPVDDLEVALEFYDAVFSATSGRREATWADVWFFAMQVTLQLAPDECADTPTRSVRHFGVTVDRETFATLVAQAEAAGARVVVPVTVDYPHTANEQCKTKIADPAGNVIEIKTYRDAHAALLRTDALEG